MSDPFVVIMNNKISLNHQRMDIPETQAILGTQDSGRKKKIEYKTKQKKKHTQKTKTKGH